MSFRLNANMMLLLWVISSTCSELWLCCYDNYTSIWYQCGFLCKWELASQTDKIVYKKKRHNGSEWYVPFKRLSMTGRCSGIWYTKSLVYSPFLFSGNPHTSRGERIHDSHVHMSLVIKKEREKQKQCFHSNQNFLMMMMTNKNKSSQSSASD